MSAGDPDRPPPDGRPDDAGRDGRSGGAASGPVRSDPTREPARRRGRLLALVLLPRIIVLFALVAWVSSAGGAARWLLLFVPVLLWEAGYTVRHPIGEDRLPQRRYREPGGHRVVLQVPGPHPVSVIREVRRTTGAGLVRANELVRSAPVILVEGISPQSAERVTECLRKAGAMVTAGPVDDLGGGSGEGRP